MKFCEDVESIPTLYDCLWINIVVCFCYMGLMGEAHDFRKLELGHIGTASSHNFNLKILIVSTFRLH